MFQSNGALSVRSALEVTVSIEATKH